MRIMKSIDKIVNGKTYYKYKINLPKKIEDTHLLDKDLKITLEKGKIIIEKE